MPIGSSRPEGDFQAFLVMAGAAPSADFPSFGRTRIRDPKQKFRGLEVGALDDARGHPRQCRIVVIGKFRRYGARTSRVRFLKMRIPLICTERLPERRKNIALDRLDGAPMVPICREGLNLGRF